MHMIEATLSAGEEPVHRHMEAAVVVDLLWNSARPEDCLEHIYSQSIEGLAAVTFFIRSKPLTDAAETVNDLCRRALGAAPALRGWQLVEAAEPDRRPYQTFRRTHP